MNESNPENNRVIRCHAAAILMGGRASRMGGYHKFLLEDRSGRTYLEKQMDELRDFDRLYLSAANEQQCHLIQNWITQKCRCLIDRVTDCGPLGGLYTVLNQLKSEDDWVFVTACDLPELKKQMIEGLLQAAAEAEDDCEVVVYQDRQGKIHPLCGLYRSSILPVIEQMLLLKDYKIMHLLIRSRCRIAMAEDWGISDDQFVNINTPENYQRWRKQGHGYLEEKQKILCICGVKNSGKTTYIEKLVRVLTADGKKVAVIKHDGHDFEGDRPGTDTFRYHEAGAIGTAIFSGYRYMLNADLHVDINTLARQFMEADIILIEGMKQSDLPKIEIVRQGISKELSCNRRHLIAVVTNCDNAFEGIEKWPLDNCMTCVRYLSDK